MSFRFWIPLSCCLLAICPAQALINLRFTPVQLARSSADIILLDVHAPRDGSPDLLAVAPNGDLWVLYGKLDSPSGPGVAVSLPAGAASAVVVSAREGHRSLGARRLTAEAPVIFWLRNPAPLDLSWQTADGIQKTRRILAVKSTKIQLGVADK
jgi:hypothetical protein